jgi:hypothetical protein
MLSSAVDYLTGALFRSYRGNYDLNERRWLTERLQIKLGGANL